MEGGCNKLRIVSSGGVLVSWYHVDSATAVLVS